MEFGAIGEDGQDQRQRVAKDCIQADQEFVTIPRRLTEADIVKDRPSVTRTSQSDRVVSAKYFI